MATVEEKLSQTDFRLCKQCNKLHTGLNTCPTCSSKLDLVDASFFMNKSLGKYKIEKILGIGGMGVVFKGIHETLHKQAAIKIFIPNVKDTSFEKRFLREARILAGLKHPNIIEVYDFDISQWGTPFYVMEYLEGRTLRDVIAEYPRGLPLQMAADLLEPVIHGLSHAHKKGIVHRDLKPANIFIERVHGKDVLKILDFGIAKRVDEGKHESSGEETTTRAVLGTPFYITPEQILNKNIGPHTDQYAIALIAAEMLTGRVIRGGKTVGEILYKDAHDTVRLEKEKHIPAVIKQALTRATSPDPKDRFPAIETFGEILIRGLRKQSNKKHITDTLQVTQSMGEMGKERKSMMPLFIILAAIVIIGGGIFIFRPFDKIGNKQIENPQPTPTPIATIAKPVPRSLFIPESNLDTPPGSIRILTYDNHTFIMQGNSGIYLLDQTNPSTPVDIPLEDNIIGGLPGGNIAFIDDFAITSRNFIDGTDNLLLRNPPAGEKYQLSQSQQFLVAQKDSFLDIYRLDSQKYIEIKKIEIPPIKIENGLTWHLGDKYLLYAHSGRIYGNLLETGDEILNLPFSTGSDIPSLFASLPGRNIAAAANQTGTKVEVYDLEKAARLQSFVVPGPSPTCALAFFTTPKPSPPPAATPPSQEELPGPSPTHTTIKDAIGEENLNYPILVIAKEDRLVFRAVSKKKVVPLYKDFRLAGLKISGLTVTAEGLLIFDQAAQKVHRLVLTTTGMNTKPHEINTSTATAQPE